jgi:nitrile hydratase subunit beta
MSAPAIATGMRVRVRRAFPPGHIRVPRYAMGAVGVVEERVGAFPDPEELAYGRSGEPPVPLYRVAFRQADLFPDDDAAPGDLLIMDIYETWLTPLTTGVGS